jgi:hypothetical protein
MFTLGFPLRYVDYLVEPTEMAARAFEEYMKAKFAAAGIVIDNAVDTDYIAQPTAEEMAVITPAFDNLFNVLQEKEGKTPGTSVLFHIGEMMEPGSEAWQLARETAMQALRDAGVDVVIVSNEDVSGMSPLTDKDGIVYGWTDGKTIYLTEAGMNPNTPIHEYTHIWARAMMQKNPKGWNNIKNLLRGTPVWNDVMNDTNYSNIHSNEDSVASEVLSRISGTENAAKLEQMAQQMIDEAKGTARKLEARGLIQRIKDALNEFWSWVGENLFEIENFNSVEEITDRVLWDLMNKTDLGKLSEGQIEAQIAGEKGAHNLDIEVEFGEGVAYRMNALELAEQLESEGFDKKQIRVAWDENKEEWLFSIIDVIFVF